MSQDPIAVLVEHGEEHGCIHMTELYEVVQKLELDEEEIESLLERLDTHGIELTDDCSRAIEEEVSYTNPALAVTTTDALQLFLNEAGRYPLLTAPQPVAARPDPGGDHRPHPRGREVRLAEGLQVLDLRDLVDPPGGAARRREQGAHDPDPGAHRRAGTEDLAGGARVGGEARARSHRRGGGEEGEVAGEAGARRACRCPDGRLARQAGRRRRLGLVRRSVRK